MRAPLVAQRHHTVIVGVLVVTAAWLAVVQADITPFVTQATANIGTGAAAFVAAVGCGLAARRHRGRPRWVWGLLGASAASWGAGQALWSVYEMLLGRELPFPSWADVGFLAAVPTAVAALLLVPSGSESAAGRVRTVLDGLVVAGSLLLLSWLTVLGPVLLSEGGDGLTTVIALAYPVGDIVLVTIVIYVLLSTARFRAAQSIPLAVVGCGLVGLAIADSGFAYLTTTDAYATGSLIDTGWFLGYLLIFAASTHRPSETGGKPFGVTARRLSTVLPYLAVIAAAVVTLIDVLPTGQLDTFTLGCWAIVMTLLLSRQVLTLFENQRLADDLRVQIEEVHASERRFRALVQHSSDIVTLVDREGVVLYQSESIRRILGHSPLDVMGSPVMRLLSPEDGADLLAAIGEHADLPMSQCTLEMAMTDEEGRARRMEVTLTNLLAEPSVRGFVLNIRDVSEQRALEDELVHQAFHDALTSLANRALFKDRVEHALLRRSTSATATDLAVLFCDLDGFKNINDSLGHAAGDSLLTLVAERLRGCVRPGDTIARLGGDEFAVLVEDMREVEDATSVAERIKDALSTPFAVAGREVGVSASIGIAAGGYGIDTCDQLLRNADLAMYRAKSEGGSYRLFDDGMHSALVEQLELEADLVRAIAEEQMVLHYQPTFEIASGRPTGVEALVRWQHPERGLLAPGHFIADAERTGLIVPLGTWVLTAACRQAVAWREGLEGAPLTMSVNVSSRQLTPDFPAIVAGILTETGLPADQLVLEITESMLVADSDSVAVLDELKALGLKIAIDDFGTGYSSLSYLHRYPVDLLKIDRSFVARIREAGGASEMITAIVQLAHSLSLETVAEGIEDRDDLEELRRIGCELGQGFHLARPAPAADVASMLGLAAAPPLAPL